MGDSKVKTLDGKPTSVADLNIEPPRVLQQIDRGVWGRVAVAYRNLSRVMAGMYTGVRCSGTPNPFHSYEDKPTSKADSDAPAE